MFQLIWESVSARWGHEEMFQLDGLRDCDRIVRLLIQTSLSAQPGLATQPRYKASGDLNGVINKCSD